MPTRALDLGCGPGLSTGLVAEAVGAATTEGIDASERFIAAARAADPRLTFTVHDVTGALPGGPAELVYARFFSPISAIRPPR